MSIPFLTSIDLNKNQILNAVMQPLATAPSNPVIGQYYYNSNDKSIHQWNGSSWDSYKITVDVSMSDTSTNPVQNKAVKSYVDNAISEGIAASDAMIFKGTIGTGGTVTALPTTYKTGWTYRVITAGTYAGNVCEVGDLIIALVDRSGSGNANSDWTVAQTNIDGAITNIQGTSPINVSSTGSTRTINHATSGVGEVSVPEASSPQSPAFGGTFKIPYIQTDQWGHVKQAGSYQVVIPNSAATQTAAGLMAAADKKKLDNLTEIKVWFDEKTIAAGSTATYFDTNLSSDNLIAVTCIMGNTPVICDYHYSSTTAGRLLVSIDSAVSEDISVKAYFIQW